MNPVDEGETQRAATPDDPKQMRRKPRRRPDPPPSTGWGRFKRWAGFEKKTLWDWLQLLVVPLMLVLVGIGFAWQQDARQNAIENRRVENERAVEERRAENARRVEDQRAQDTALQAYLDQMSGLMIGDEPLLDSEEGSVVRTLARARTATVVQRLDAERNQEVMRFLGEAGLTGNEPRSDDEPPPFSLLSGNDLRGAALMEVSLVEADLSGADLTDTDLREAFLPEADLREAVLTDTDLYGADLPEAVLRDANLSGADLSGADLSGAIGVTRGWLEEQTSMLEGAIMPDGSKHP